MRFIVTASVLLSLCQQQDAEASASSSVLLKESSGNKRKLRGRSQRSSNKNLDGVGLSSSFSNHDRQENRRRRRKIIQKNQDDGDVLKNGGSNTRTLLAEEEGNESTNDIFVECDPSSIKDAAAAAAIDNADSGILSSCAKGYYCIESQTSSKGGICVADDERKQLAQNQGDVLELSSSSLLRLQNNINEQEEQQRKLIQGTTCSLSSSCGNGYFCDFENMFSGGGNCEICPCPVGSKGTEYMCGYIHDPLELVTEHGKLACQINCFGWTGTCGDFTSIVHKFDNCDLSQYDSTTGSGTKSCTSDEYCGYGCCYTMGGIEVFDSNGNLESNSIYYHFTAPYSQDVTITYYDSASVVALGLQDNCSITINNERCTSCNKVGDEFDQCIDFDCQNISSGIGKSGSTCDADGTFVSFNDLMPIYYECFFGGDGCNFCGVDSGNTLTYNFFATTAVVPGYNERFYCGDIMEAGLGRLFGDNGSDTCNEVSKLAAHKCCTNPPDQASICNICDRYNSGSILTEFEKEVPFTGKSCIEFYLDGLLERRDLADCPDLANSAGPHCCSVP